VAADPSLARYGDVFQKEGIAALGFIPLVSGGRLLGKFMVYFDRPRRISATDMDVARAIAHHVAAGVARFAATKELQETVHFNEMFTGVLGHDLRNPLGAIMIAAQHAARRNDTEKLRAPLSRIITSGGRMARMIDQLLDFTRIRLGVGAGLPIDPRPCDLLPVIRQVVDELQSTNPAQVLNVQNVGNTEGAWDPDRLGQVFSNLIANAIQHGTAQSPVAIRVLGVRHDCLRVEVRNRGTIPADLLPRVFEPLARGNRRSDRSQGLGLGLYISNQLVKAHGGQIEVLCTPDQETIFTAVLPRTRAS
jgi:signal transduction histidine kinase